jgi:hypothetical protein
MTFENHTPFPAIAWSNIDKDSKEYTTLVVRVKYLFDKQDTSGLWRLKLAKEQEELFEEDIFYEENMKASVLYESDYISHKPHGDLIINAYSHEDKERSSWVCGVEVIRENKNSFKTILEQKVRVYAKRDWHWWLNGWSIYESRRSKKIALRYENSYGGYSLNPKWEEDKENELEYLDYFEANPVGKGVAHKKALKGIGNFPAHQIEAIHEKVSSINKNVKPQGFGFINRSWMPRLGMLGTEESVSDVTLLPTDFNEQHYNAAHENMQLKHGYFEPKDIIILEKMLKGKAVQAFSVPSFYFYGDNHLNREDSKFILNIDTIILELRSDDMENNSVYVSYRKRLTSKVKVKTMSLNMIVPEDFKAKKIEDVSKKEDDGYGR